MAEVAGGGTGPVGKGTTKYLCGTPHEHCGGSSFALSHGLERTGGRRVHQTSEQSFNCYKHYLLSIGYTQVDSRAFAPPVNEDGSSGGPIHVMTKKSRFGSRLRPGKGKRSMPSHPRTGGTIVSM